MASHRSVHLAERFAKPGERSDAQLNAGLTLRQHYARAQLPEDPARASSQSGGGRGQVSHFSANTPQNHMTLRIGQRVRLPSTGEVGVVVWLWVDEHGDVDAYVAFFGTKFPGGEPAGTPYVLRYYANTLEALE